MPFWRAVLGYEQVGAEDLLDPHRRGWALADAEGNEVDVATWMGRE
jgi:hypothetical protein